MTRSFAFLSICIIGVCVGCDAKTSPQPTASAPSQTPEKTPQDPVATPQPTATSAAPGEQSVGGDITVAMIDAAGFTAAVAKHQGKVVLVDCWATWCLPCIKGFPSTLALGRQHADEGLVVISLSFDDPADEETLPNVLEFLKKQAARCENYISRLDLEQGGTEAFDIEGGSIPHYKLYGRDGKLLKTFSNSDPDHEFSHEMLAAAVAEALK